MGTENGLERSGDYGGGVHGEVIINEFVKAIVSASCTDRKAYNVRCISTSAYSATKWALVINACSTHGTGC